MLGIEDVAVAVFRIVYRRVPHRTLRDRRPWFQLFPKYRSKVDLAPEILEAEDPDGELEARVRALGFSFDSWTKERIRFTRGKAWGDFSVRLIKLDLSLTHPLQPRSALELEVGGVCVFDTGDVWKVCREVVERIEAPADPDPR